MRLVATRLRAVANRTSSLQRCGYQYKSFGGGHAIRPASLRNATLRWNSTAPGASTILQTPPVAPNPLDVDPIQSPLSVNSEGLRIATLKPDLPQSCPGCGALSQENVADAPGFYNRSRKAVKEFLKAQRKTLKQEEDLSKDESEDTERSEPLAHKNLTAPALPMCDRCHDLIYNSRGESIAHPTVDAIADSIAESPFERNHIYHVLDAADFPMSLIPGLHTRLELAKPRSRNRRSQHHFGKKPTMSFIITRSDLLGAEKEMVDSMMPYFKDTLRKALGRSGEKLRLGNVHLVSAKRGWWTKDIKEDIRKRGGGNWMVGKANVGKSNLFEVLFPKNSGDKAPKYSDLQKQQESTSANLDLDNHISPAKASETEILPEDSLLPPAQPETPFPVFPLVSGLPGTTASPIRLPFGDHRGELIDLPGAERSTLENYVRKEHRLDLIMENRHKVEQLNLRPGQSLILGGGLIRITPRFDGLDESATFLIYSFVPLQAHITSTEKAIGQQTQQRQSGIQDILAEGVGPTMAKAGAFPLDTEVTRQRAGTMLRAGVSLDRLPFRIWATDILIEGVGWVELVCQTRKKRAEVQPATSVTSLSPDFVESNTSEIALEESSHAFSPFASISDAGMTEVLDMTAVVAEGVTSSSPKDTTQSGTSSSEVPIVEVFSPQGRFVSQRSSLGAWVRWTEGRKTHEKETKKARPRQSMRGAKARARSK